jgi:hypothetical protein
MKIGYVLAFLMGFNLSSLIVSVDYDSEINDKMEHNYYVGYLHGIDTVNQILGVACSDSFPIMDFKFKNNKDSVFYRIDNTTPLRKITKITYSDGVFEKNITKK